MLRILIGEEPYLIDREIKKVIESLSFPEINLGEFDEVNDELIEHCSTYPVMDDKRVIILSLDSLSEDIKEFTNISEFVELIVLPRTIDGRKSYVKDLKKGGYVEEYPKLKEEQIRAFVLKKVRDNGCKITEKAFLLLLERIGYYEEVHITLYTVELYLRQLALLGEVIGEESIKKVIPPTCNEEVYALSTALLNREFDRALMLSRRFMERGEHPIQLLSLLLRPFRLAYKKSLFSASAMSEACASIGVSAYQLKSLTVYSEETLGAAMDLIEQGILSTKSGGGVSAFYLAISKLCLLLDEQKAVS